MNGRPGPGGQQLDLAHDFKFVVALLAGVHAGAAVVDRGRSGRDFGRWGHHRAERLALNGRMARQACRRILTVA